MKKQREFKLVRRTTTTITHERGGTLQINSRINNSARVRWNLYSRTAGTDASWQKMTGTWQWSNGFTYDELLTLRQLLSTALGEQGTAMMLTQSVTADHVR